MCHFPVCAWFHMFQRLFRRQWNARRAFFLSQTNGDGTQLQFSIANTEMPYHPPSESSVLCPVWTVISLCTDHIFNLLSCSVVALPYLNCRDTKYMLMSYLPRYPVILWCGQHMLIGTSCLSCFSSIVLWTILYYFCVSGVIGNDDCTTRFKDISGFPKHSTCEVAYPFVQLIR